jgi:hypothetical protein
MDSSTPDTHIDRPGEGELGEQAVSLRVERSDDAVVVRGHHPGGAAASKDSKFQFTSSFLLAVNRIQNLNR